MAKELNKLETKFDEGMERKQIAQIKSFKSCEESNQTYKDNKIYKDNKTTLQKIDIALRKNDPKAID